MTLSELLDEFIKLKTEQIQLVGMVNSLTEICNRQTDVLDKMANEIIKIKNRI